MDTRRMVSAKSVDPLAEKGGEEYEICVYG